MFGKHSALALAALIGASGIGLLSFATTARAEHGKPLIAGGPAVNGGKPTTGPVPVVRLPDRAIAQPGLIGRKRPPHVTVTPRPDQPPGGQHRHRSLRDFGTPQLYPLPQVPSYRAPEINVRPLRPSYGYGYVDRAPIVRDVRLSCNAVAALLARRGYKRVSASDCAGGTYSFRASRDGRRYLISVDAYDGGVVGRTRL